MSGEAHLPSLFCPQGECIEIILVFLTGGLLLLYFEFNFFSSSIQAKLTLLLKDMEKKGENYMTNK